MPGESRGTLRAAPCACVELISSPPSLLPSSHPSVPSPSFAFPSAGSARGEYGVPRDLAPLPLRAHSPSSLLHRCVSSSTIPSSVRLFSLSYSLSYTVVLFLLPLYLPVPPLFTVASPFYVVASYILRYWHPLIKPPLLFSTALFSFVYLSSSRSVSSSPFLLSSRSLRPLSPVWHVFLFLLRSLVL